MNTTNFKHNPCEVEDHLELCVQLHIRVQDEWLCAIGGGKVSCSGTPSLFRSTRPW